MPRLRKIAGGRPRPLLAILWLSGLATALCVFAATLWAQNSGQPAGSASDPSPPTQPSTIETKAPPPIELDEKEPEPSLFKKIDTLFGDIVKAMAKVLFYSVGASEQQYIVLDHVEHYVRPRGAKGQPFTKYDPRGEHQAEQIAPATAQALAKQGKLIMSAADRPKGEGKFYRHGKIPAGEDAEGNPKYRLVDYVSVLIDNKTKYVRTEENGLVVFKKVLKPVKRNNLSEKKDDWLTPEEVEELAARGWLKLDEDKDKDKDKAKKPKPYLLSETTPNSGAPVVVLWLAFGAVFFTIYMTGVNIWGFGHAVQIVRGKYDNPNDDGEVSHFQALTSALSATVGLGNIAGVTIAMTVGGPGAFFWMLMCGLFGMTSKFVECTLGQKYRRVKEDGTVLGGPMQYLHAGLKELGLGPLGLVLAILFAIMCILASFGGGNMFQANQSGAQVLSVIQKEDRIALSTKNAEIRNADPADLEKIKQLETEKEEIEKRLSVFETAFKPVYGVILAIFVGLVILGGIRRIGAAAEKIVPSMCILYILACLWIIGAHVAQVPELIGQIFSEAFAPSAISGGLIGVLVIGVQRAAFSNEAGVGSASIAHSAARTDEPVREGAVALLGPFIDTIVVCSMTALVILITGAWDNSKWVVEQDLEGAALTTAAFGAEISWFPYVLVVAVVLFAFSTIVAWSYYGERCWERLFGPRSTIVYKIIYVGCVVLGAIVNLGNVLDFSDMMILSMAFPNILGLVLLSPKVRRDLMEYWRRYKAGEFKTYK